MAFHTITLFLLLALLSGCSTAPLVLTNEYNGPNKNYLKKESAPAESIQCRLNVLKIEDQRNNKETMGKMGLQYVYYNNFVEWLGNGFNSLNNNGFVTFVDQEYVHENEDIDMAVVVKKAYIRNTSSSKISTLVLDVSYFNNDEALGKNIYRGSHTSVNWTGSESEVKEAFDISLSQILSEISADVLSYCSRMKDDNLEPELNYNN